MQQSEPVRFSWPSSVLGGVHTYVHRTRQGPGYLAALFVDFFVSGAERDQKLGFLGVTVLFEVLAGKRRGRWQPDGTFRNAFLSRNARALRDIRNLLSRDDWEETALLESFRRLLNTRLPQGVYLPKSVRATETAKFHKRVRRYVSCRNKSN